MKLIRRVNNQTDSFRFKVRDGYESSDYSWFSRVCFLNHNHAEA